jgi:hypothetical protein
MSSIWQSVPQDPNIDLDVAVYDATRDLIFTLPMDRVNGELQLHTPPMFLLFGFTNTNRLIDMFDDGQLVILGEL